MTTSLADSDLQPNVKRTWSRQDSAVNLAALAHAKRKGCSERSFSLEYEIPRTTLQGWQSRRDQIEAAPVVVAFFESPEGVGVLERLTLAAHVVMTFEGNSGIRGVSAFLEYAGLGRFIGCSYGAQQQVASEVLDLVTAYGTHERDRLAADMPHKSITLCLDETFPAGGMCLVAMEPASGYIVAEEYQHKRDTSTWSDTIERATNGMKVKVEQITSDEAKAIVRYAGDQNAHHSPDLFHVQQEITRALGRAVDLPVRRAQEALTASTADQESRLAEKMAYNAQPRRQGRPPSFDKRIQEARTVVARDEVSLNAAKTQHDRYTAAVHGISDQYHPYVLSTGAPRTADMLADELHAHFTELHDLASEIGSSEKAVAKLKKAERISPKMVTTLAFFHQQVDARLTALELSRDQRGILTNSLIPAAYLMIAAPKARTAERTEALRQVATEMMATHKAEWLELSSQEQRELNQIARGCAEIFQRSSSCVEGRNGRLALAEHARRQLPESKLRALTVMHNYATKRSDGTTAAERFFGAPAQDLFAWLLTRFSGVPRPAQPRQNANKLLPLLC